MNNKQIDNVHYIDVVTPMYNLNKYSDNYSKTSGILHKYCKDVTAIHNHDIISAFNVNNATNRSFNLKRKITSKTSNDGIKNVEIMIPFKYVSIFWKTFEMFLINCEINLDLNWSKICVIVANYADQATTFSIVVVFEFEFYLIWISKVSISVVTLSTQDNAKLLEQLKSGFKGVTN